MTKAIKARTRHTERDDDAQRTRTRHEDKPRAAKAHRRAHSSGEDAAKDPPKKSAATPRRKARTDKDAPDNHTKLVEGKHGHVTYR
jgi:hypothetical protein